MTDKEPIAPSLEDLSHAQVESSRLFGFTNISGKALALISLTTLCGGAAGIAQGLGFLGPVMGLSATFPIGLAALGASVATGLAGYWLGNFDDKRIKTHNSRAAQAFSRARGTVYDKIERGFMQALAKVEYDPAENSLPYDALGHAILLTDEKIDTLPDHVRMDVYRTQLDLELYRHKQITSHTSVQGKRFEEKTLALATMAEKATAYKNCRDSVRRAILNGTLSITPLAAEERKRAQDETDIIDASEIDAVDVIADAINAFSRSSRHIPRSGSVFRSGGGGDFGGGGASGSWLDGKPSGNVNASGSAMPFFVSDAGAATGKSENSRLGSAFEWGSSGSSGSGSSSGGSSFDIGDIDGDSAGPLLIIAGAAAVVAASAVAGFSVWKNFISQAETPALGNVHLPMISKSLASAEKDVRKMYTPV